MVQDGNGPGLVRGRAQGCLVKARVDVAHARVAHPVNGTRTKLKASPAKASHCQRGGAHPSTPVKLPLAKDMGAPLLRRETERKPPSLAIPRQSVIRALLRNHSPRVSPKSLFRNRKRWVSWWRASQRTKHSVFVVCPSAEKAWSDPSEG